MNKFVRCVISIVVLWFVLVMVSSYTQTQPSFQNFSSRWVRLLSWLPLSAFGNNVSNANDCWGYVSPGGHEYAIIGFNTGTGFVDITDPTNPRIVAFVSANRSFGRDMKTVGEYCYTACDSGGGMQIIDLRGIDKLFYFGMGC